MPKKVGEKLVKVLITLAPDVAAELKQRARDRSEPGKKVSQGDVVAELLQGYVIEPEFRSSFDKPKKERQEKPTIEIPRQILSSWRKPIIKGKTCPHGKEKDYRCVFCAGGKAIIE